MAAAGLFVPQVYRAMIKITLKESKKCYLSQKFSSITIHNFDPVIPTRFIILQHEVSEENLNHTPSLHLDGVDLVHFVRIVTLAPTGGGHKIVASLVTIHFLQKSDVRAGKPCIVTAEVAGRRVLGRHGGPRGPVVPVMHDAHAVVRRPMSLALRPLTLTVLVPGTRAVLNVVPVHGDVIVTI